MPGYVRKALTRFQHPHPEKQQDQPYPHVKPNYGGKKQYSQKDDDSPALSKAGKKFIQEVCGVFLFLARAVDGGLLPALSSLVSQQAKPNRENNGAMQAVFGLHVMPRRSRTNLLSKRYGSRNPQRRVIPIRAQIPQPRRRPHVHGGKRQNPHQQRGSP